MKPIAKILTLLALAVIPLSACTGESDCASTTNYRPDLDWTAETVAPTMGYDVSNPVYRWYAEPESAVNIPVRISATVLTDDGEEKVDLRAYLQHLDWEILPDDAWTYIESGAEGDLYAVAPSVAALDQFDVSDMMEFYELDPSLLSEEKITAVISHCALKTE